jgi:non-ribosomal peptide synthetase component F
MLVDAVRKAAGGAPEAVAIRSGGAAWTYQQLVERAEDWSGRLRKLAAAPGAVVAIVTAGHPEVPSLMMAVRLNHQVPLLIDRLQPPSRTEHVIAAARPAIVVDLDRDAEPAARDDARLLSPSVGYLTFSSGSQGSPKGILGNEAGLVQFLDWQRERIGLRRHHNVGALTSPSFDVVYRDLFLPLTSGATLVLPPVLTRAGEGVASWLAESEVHAVHLVPSLSARMTSAATTPAPALRWSMFAGEPLHDAHVRRWRSVAPNTRILNLYGPAEATLASFEHEVVEPLGPGPQPVGTALPGRSLVRLESLAEPDEFRVGIRYEHLAHGYLEGTVTRVEHDRFTHLEDGSRLFRTDDRGAVGPAGQLILRGRLGSLVKRRGTFVDLARIEQAALSSPSVFTACALQDEGDGKGEITLYVGFDGSEVPEGDLPRRLRQALGADTPDRVVFLAVLPRLPSGKIDRQALAAEARAPREVRTPAR